MKQIRVLNQKTIDQIAAGEVVERPASIVKELVENAVDAQAGAITVEITDGGVSQIRVTDNGEGIDESQVRNAFLRHATSKLETLSDLDTIQTHGFRGEALSSIGAVSMAEMITKRAGSLTGTRYRFEGGKETGFEQIGAPEGTTVLIRNLFYNTPARKKFLKSPVTEAGYVGELMERLALSHPEISFKFISGQRTKLYTSGNNQLKDVIYGIYGRETFNALVSAGLETDGIRISGFVGKPQLSRGNRNLENYFVNGRFVRSQVISKAVEEAYRPYLMQHKFPFTCLMISIDGHLVDVNVHPAKLEVRFGNAQAVYDAVLGAVSNALKGRDLIREVTPETAREEHEAEQAREKERKEQTARMDVPEPFEALRKTLMAGSESPYQPKYPKVPHHVSTLAPALGPGNAGVAEKKTPYGGSPEKKEEIKHVYVQQELDTEPFLDVKNTASRHIIGQLFDTYWLVQFEDSLYIIDQHAAHEKVLYERLVRRFKERKVTSQTISPPVILALSAREENTLKRFDLLFREAGFEIEHFGGSEYQLCAAPDTLPGLTDRELLVEMLDSLSEQAQVPAIETLFEKLASMACKSAVKGGNRLSDTEARALIDELMSLENPYNCPHGRPTIIRMSRTELEKKFKRII